MYPKIKIKVGRGYDPVELQKHTDTDLTTEAKTVVGAINELHKSVDNGTGGTGGTSKTIDAQEHAAYGDELAGVDGWIADGWTGNFTEGFTHENGNTSPLIFTMPENTGTNMYQVTFDSTVAPTDTNLFVTIGDSATFSLYGQPSPYGVGIQSVENGNLMFIPESGFTGTISNISVKRITDIYESIPSKSVIDSNDQIAFEMRATKADDDNVFIGKKAGQYNTTGFGNIALGSESLSKNTSGFWNIGFGYQALQTNTVGSRNVGIGFGAFQFSAGTPHRRKYFYRIILISKQYHR